MRAPAGDLILNEKFRRWDHQQGANTMTIRLHPAPPPIRGDAEEIHAHDRSRLRAAAQHARRLYPGGLGELVHRELTAYADFGFRFVGDALIPRLATEILDTPSRYPNSASRSASE